MASFLPCKRWMTEGQVTKYTRQIYIGYSSAGRSVLGKTVPIEAAGVAVDMNLGPFVIFPKNTRTYERAKTTRITHARTLLSFKATAKYLNHVLRALGTNIRCNLLSRTMLTLEI